MTEWRAISGYDGRYFISSAGEVKSIYGSCKLIKHYQARGYHKVNLRLKKRQTAQHVHRLVAFAFIPNPENKPYVNHIDGVKSNNNKENLEWCTASENNSHAYKIGLKKYTGVKIAVERYDKTGAYIDTYDSACSAAKKLNMEPSCITRCCKKKRKTAGGYKWRYKNAS